MNWWVDLLLRWTHIFSAIALVGGVFFMRWSLVPALNCLDATSQEKIQAVIRQRWARVVMATSALLLFSGLINAVLAIKRYEFGGGTYHIFVALKLLLALVVFWLTATLSGRRATAERFQKNMSFWLNINILIATTLVCIAGGMKMSERTRKPDDPSVVESCIRWEVPLGGRNVNERNCFLVRPFQITPQPLRSAAAAACTAAVQVRSGFCVAKCPQRVSAGSIAVYG